MRTTTAVLAGALATALGLGAGAVLAARPPEPPCKVGFVDFNKVITGYQKATDQQASLMKDFEALQDLLKKRDSDLRKRAGDLQSFEAGTAEYERMRREIDLEGQSIQYDMNAGKASLQRKHVKLVHRLYTEIRAEVQRIGQARGFSAVLLVDDDPISIEDAKTGEFMSRSELQIQLATRPVLFHEKGLEITADVLAALNGPGGVPEKKDDEKKDK